MPTDMNTLLCLPQTPHGEITADTPQMHRTLIVLIPPGLETSLLSHQIWQLSKATEMHVLLLSMVGNEANESDLRRGMVTLSAILQVGKITADVKIETGTNWVDIVKLHYHPGDMIVCPAEYRSDRFHRPLRRILEAKLDTSTYVLSITEVHKESSNWKSEILAWSGFIGLLLGFGLLQLGIVRSTSGGMQSTLLILATLLEFWLFGVWNNLTH